MTTYLAEGRRVSPDSDGFAEAIARARARGSRPLCLCQPDGLPMVVARLGPALLLKRMPLTGSLHDPSCPSYEPSLRAGPIARIQATAEAPDTPSRLRLAFSLSAASPTDGPRRRGEHPREGCTAYPAVSLLGLLQFLWHDAGLTRWCPGFAGKRSWATVRGHLFVAARRVLARDRPLSNLLYIPEPFRMAQAGSISARREARWLETTHGGRSFMLLIAELKVVKPERQGFHALIKHVPDLTFGLDEGLFRRMAQRYASALLLWNASSQVRMIVAATCAIESAHKPRLIELALMPVTTEWIPVDDAAELLRLNRRVGQAQSFTRLPRDHPTDSDPNQAMAACSGDMTRSHPDSVRLARTVEASPTAAGFLAFVPEQSAKEAARSSDVPTSFRIENSTTPT